MAFGRMQSELGYSYAEIADRLGKSKGYVQNRMRLLQLDDDLQLLVAERPDTLGHVYEIARVDDAAARAQLIAAVRDDALSRAATRAQVQALLQPPSASVDDKSYFQKYDRDTRHEQQPDDTLKADKSYFQKYDRDKHHEQPGREPASKQPEAGSTEALLTAKERAMLAAVTTKVERLLDDAKQLTAEDWAILSPLALRLSDLLRRVGQAQRRD